MRIETDSQHYTDIAEAIRDMNGTENTYYPEEMASAILAIPQETYDVYAPIIYSLEEREVGVWCDGKPLYEKTVHINSLPSTAYVLTSYPHGISNIDTICTHNAFAKWSSGEVANLDHIGLTANDSTSVFRASIELTIDNTNIYIRCGADRSGLSANVIIQYTKTTDAPGSGTWGTDGVPMVHYDGTERIIGTWFGETLYQKSYDLGSDVSIDYTRWTEINVNYPTNCNLIIQVDCTTSGGTYAAGILLSKKSNGKFEMQTTRNGNHQSLRYFTIKYTKTT